MFHQDHPSEAYAQFLYWCISDEHPPRIARARMDVPYSALIDALSEEERAFAKPLVAQRLAETNSSIFYVQLAAYFEDASVIPLIEKELKTYKDLKRSYEMSVCQDALRRLKAKQRG